MMCRSPRRRWTCPLLVSLLVLGLRCSAALGQQQETGLLAPPCRPIKVVPGLLSPGQPSRSETALPLAAPHPPARLDASAAAEWETKRTVEPPVRDRLALRTPHTDTIEEVFGRDQSKDEKDSPGPASFVISDQPDEEFTEPKPTPATSESAPAAEEAKPTSKEAKPTSKEAKPTSEESEPTAKESAAAEEPTPAIAESESSAAQSAPEPSQQQASTPPPLVTAKPALAVARPRAVPPSVRALRTPLQQCLQWYSRQLLNTRDDSPWSMMHSLLGGGAETAIHVGGPQGQRASAAQWLLHNQPCAGHSLFTLADGRIRGREGPGFQGHPAQCLAIVAQCGIPSTYSLQVGGQQMTIADLVAEEQRTCVEDMELTFKLIGLSFYVDSDTAWVSDQGESWDIPKLIRLELAQPINGVTCGGTHRLMGLTCAVRRRQADGKPVEDQWWRADKFAKDYYAYTLSLQNRDGSFSTDWFRRRADSGTMDRKMQTTGHMLEWLVFSVPDEMLYDPRVVRAVNYLTTLMIENRFNDWQVGYKGHAVRALRLYHERVFGPLPAQVPPLADRSPATGVRSTVQRLFGPNR